MRDECLSDYALEKRLHRVDKPEVTSHLTVCLDCSARLEAMEAERIHFHQYVRPATHDRLLERHGARSWRRRFIWGLGVPVLAAAAFVLMPAAPVQNEAEYVGTKGRADDGGSHRLRFATYVQEAGKVRAVSNGESLPADATIRFQVWPDEPCWLSIVSVDQSGVVSRVYPAEGAATETSRGGPVPGGAVLDGQPGFERFYAICGPDQPPFDRLKAMALASPSELPLPANTSQATLLIEKNR